jgi:hypothetical protein
MYNYNVQIQDVGNLILLSLLAISVIDTCGKFVAVVNLINFRTFRNGATRIIRGQREDDS